MSSEAESFLISDPLTVPELEHIYHEVVLKQDFYSESYGCEWTLEPYEDMAQMLRDVIAPTKYVDVGCGKGFLAMRASITSSIGAPAIGLCVYSRRSTFIHSALGFRGDFPVGE